MLTERFHSLLEQGWSPVFAQDRSRHRAIEHAMALPSLFGRRTISRSICVLGRSQQDWSADYKIFSRSCWQADRLFDPVIQAYLHRYPKGPIVVAVDDTKLAKTGKKIPNTHWQRDPMSPPFHVNLQYGLRYVQACFLFPHYKEGDYSTRGFPVRFQEAPPVKKPRKKATEEERKQYLKLKKEINLSKQTLEIINALRTKMDEKGATQRSLLVAVDGSFCNSTMFKSKRDRVELVARCRKDARLCFPAKDRTRRKYAKEIFTPEQVRQDAHRPWKRARIYFAGKRRSVRCKEIDNLLWRRGAGTRGVRLVIVAPVPYKLSKHSRVNYREPAYLLCTDQTRSIKLILQAYFDRWQIEVNHRDEKSLLGVGQAQVRSPQSVTRHPAFAVACYSMMLLAALQEFGPGRTHDYLLLPKWRKNAKRPSLLDILSLMRKELNETSVSGFLNRDFSKNTALHAYT